jgi:hypothetical protein
MNSKALKTLLPPLEQACHGYLISSDYREVIETLRSWGVVRSGSRTSFGMLRTQLLAG